MGGRHSTVIAEADIIDDYSPRRKGRRPKHTEVTERRPANPWVELPGYTPARPVKAPVSAWPPMEVLYEERPAYSL